MTDLIKAIIIKLFYVPKEDREAGIIFTGIILFLIAAICLAEWMVSCTPAPVVVEAPITKVCGYGEWCVEWDSYIAESVTPLMLQTDVGLFCKKRPTDMVDFWVSMTRAISFAESGWKMNETYIEKTQGIDPVTKQQSTSEGLMQISYKDSIHDFYKKTECANVSYKTKNIQNPYINIKCSMAIFNTLLSNNSNNIKELGRYWATMRPTNKRFGVTAKKFKELMPWCSI